MTYIPLVKDCEQRAQKTTKTHAQVTWVHNAGQEHTKTAPCNRGKIGNIRLNIRSPRRKQEVVRRVHAISNQHQLRGAMFGHQNRPFFGCSGRRLCRWGCKAVWPRRDLAKSSGSECTYLIHRESCKDGELAWVRWSRRSGHGGVEGFTPRSSAAGSLSDIAATGR